MGKAYTLKPTSTDRRINPQNSIPFISLNGINPLISAAIPLLLLIARIKNATEHKDVINLRRQIISEITAFEMRAKASQCLPQLILAARYCLCTSLDEAVLLTPWGGHSAWAHQTLLSIFHKETWGGERFFIILEKMSQEAKQNLSLLELIYLLLSFGFEGKYYDQGKGVRDEIRHRLFQLIIKYREPPHRHLSPSLNKSEKRELINKKQVPNWKIAAITITIVIILCFAFNIATYFSARKILQELNDISRITGSPIINTPKNNNPFINKKINARHNDIQDESV